jgi:PAS domain S-box-containing protein
LSQEDPGLDQAYLAAIVAHSDDAIISKDLDGVIQTFNAAAERLFGYKAEEIIGLPVTVLIPPDRQHEEVEILARLRRGEPIDHFETVRVSKDGRHIDISLTVSPVRNAEGKIIGASKIARDITERKRVARVLAAQQEWSRVTLASIGDAVIAADPKGRVTYMNAVAEKLTAWPSDEAIGRPLSDVFHIVNEKTRRRVESPATKVIREGKTVGLANHTVLIARDGSEWPIDDSAAPILVDPGRIIGVVLVFHDVTEQRRIQSTLAEQREWLETTLESIGDAVIATDVNERVTFMNPIAEHLTGWKAADARGRPVKEVFRIVNELTRRDVPSPVGRVLREGVVVGVANHTLLIGLDGTERAIDDSGAPIRDSDDRIVGVVLVFRDVTERRRLDQERQNAIHERELLLARERQARAEAERANQVKDDFVAMVSHELRTPLSAIMGWTNVLRAKEESPDILRHGLEVIARNAGIQAQLISDLLDVSRIASGKLLLEPERVDLAELVEESVEAVQHGAKEQGVTLVCQFERRPPPTVGDPGRLKQVVWNLLVNAIKFTPKGGRVTVVLRSTEAHAEILVIDTGIGIRSEDLGAIFQRFGQGGASTTRRYGGLGLGLAIARHLVELHGGSLRAASEGENRGSTFTVELPLAVPVKDESIDRSEALEPLDDRVSLQGVTVLVVEDEADMRSMIRLILEEHGAKVRTASSAPAALATLDPSVDILLSDIRLPDMDGYELIRRIRQRGDELARIPAIALTAFARSEDHTRAMRAGFQAHIAKPFDHSELVLTLASFAEILRLQRR